MNPLYSLQKISKVFRNNGVDVVALDNIDMEIKKGERLCIMGVSGSGKSTLLHILGGLERPSRGNVYYNGVDLFSHTDDEICDIRNREIGFVFQFHYLLPEFSALENVMMPCLIQGIKIKEAKQKASDILERVGLGGRLSHRPGELSGGEQQRVSIARAMVMGPRVILADEPTGNLDLNTGLSIIDLFLKLNEQDGVTLVTVTHDPNIAAVFDKKVIISDGKIINEKD